MPRDGNAYSRRLRLAGGLIFLIAARRKQCQGRQDNQYNSFVHNPLNFAPRLRGGYLPLGEARGGDFALSELPHPYHGLLSQCKGSNYSLIHKSKLSPKFGTETKAYSPVLQQLALRRFVRVLAASRGAVHSTVRTTCLFPE